MRSVQLNTPRRPTSGAWFRVVARVSIALVVMASPATASLIDSNDASLASYQSSDGNNLTLDTTTGLEWLDIDATALGLSYDAMSAQLGAGELAGFRYATLTEVDDFFIKLGLPPIAVSTPVSDPGGTITAAAAAHTGLTIDNAFQRTATGLTGTPFDASRHFTAFYRLNTLPEDLFTGSAVVANDAVPSSSRHWIVRPTAATSPVVPEPAAVTVWTLLAGLAFSLRRGLPRCRRQ